MKKKSKLKRNITQRPYFVSGWCHFPIDHERDRMYLEFDINVKATTVTTAWTIAKEKISHNFKDGFKIEFHKYSVEKLFD